MSYLNNAKKLRAAMDTAGNALSDTPDVCKHEDRYELMYAE